MLRSWLSRLSGRQSSASAHSRRQRPEPRTRRLRIESLEDRCLLAVSLADLGVDKEGPANAAPGEILTYSITVTNHSLTEAATNVRLTDLIPQNTTFVSFSSNDDISATTPSSGGTGTVRSNVGTLAAGASATFQLQLRLGNVLGGTRITNTARVTADNEGGPRPNFDSVATIAVSPVTLQGTNLVVLGTDKHDNIAVKRTNGNTAVNLNGQIFKVPNNAINLITIFGFGDQDNITVDANVPTNTFIFGGDGQDNISTGSRTGNDVIDGGKDQDNISSKGGRDILIGGDGHDNITAGGSRGSILIGGSVTGDEQVLRDLAAAFQAGNPNVVDDIFAALAAGDIDIEDDDLDTLGGDGPDLFFRSSEDNVARGRRARVFRVS